jgi:hypothetical protein
MPEGLWLLPFLAAVLLALVAWRLGDPQPKRHARVVQAVGLTVPADDPPRPASAHIRQTINPDLEFPIAEYLELASRGAMALGRTYRELADAHSDDLEIAWTCHELSAQCDRHARELEAFTEWYGGPNREAPEALPRAPFHRDRRGFVRELIEVYVMAAECKIAWSLLDQAGRTLRDAELVAVAGRSDAEMTVQLNWLRTWLQRVASRVMVVT